MVTLALAFVSGKKQLQHGATLIEFLNTAQIAAIE